MGAYQFRGFRWAAAAAGGGGAAGCGGGARGWGAGGSGVLEIGFGAVGSGGDGCWGWGDWVQVAAAVVILGCVWGQRAGEGPGVRGLRRPVRLWST